MDLAKELEKIFESATIKPGFKDVHVILALILFGSEENKPGIGRYKLRKYLNLSEGRVKSLLTRMKKADLIKKDTRITGHVITEHGLEMLSAILSRMTAPRKPDFEFGNLAVGPKAYYSLVKGAAGKIGNGMRQRDEVIKIGGTGATCLIYKNGKFYFPPTSGGEPVEAPLDPRYIDPPPSEGDVLIIGSGENDEIARLGTLAAALTLL